MYSFLFFLFTIDKAKLEKKYKIALSFLHFFCKMKLKCIKKEYKYTIGRNEGKSTQNRR